MKQFGNQEDERLNELTKRIVAAQRKLDAAEAEKNEAWASVFAIFNQAGLTGQPARFIAQDGEHVLVRQIVQPDPILQPDQLRTVLRTTRGDAAYKRVWSRITVATRVIDEDKLADAVAHGAITQEELAAGVKQPSAYPKRILTNATKADREALAMLADDNRIVRLLGRAAG